MAFELCVLFPPAGALGGGTTHGPLVFFEKLCKQLGNLFELHGCDLGILQMLESFTKFSHACSLNCPCFVIKIRLHDSMQYVKSLSNLD